MFDRAHAPEGRPSVLEERLRGWTEDRGPLRVELFSPGRSSPSTAGPGLGPPPESPGYRPSAELRRFVRARDRRCRFPGCRARAERCDLDHTTPYPYPAGATSCDNLCCLCRHHHRLSHQAPGWTMPRIPDGGLAWTTPSGDRLTTQPPRYGTDDDLPHRYTDHRDPSPGRPTAHSPLRERVLGRPAPPTTAGTTHHPSERERAPLGTPHSGWRSGSVGHDDGVTDRGGVPRA